jgi:hypothetical protein
MTQTKQRSRETLLELSLKQTISYKIKLMGTASEKRALIIEHNPMHYIFGEYRRVWKPYLTYRENIEVQHLGEMK